MMEIFDKFKEKKEVKRPNLIVFEKENVDNDYANFELKIKPRISIEEDLFYGTIYANKENGKLESNKRMWLYEKIHISILGNRVSVTYSKEV